MLSKKALATEATLYGWPSMMKCHSRLRTEPTMGTIDLLGADIQIFSVGRRNSPKWTHRHDSASADYRMMPTKVSPSFGRLHGMQGRGAAAPAIEMMSLEWRSCLATRWDHWSGTSLHALPASSGTRMAATCRLSWALAHNSSNSSNVGAEMAWTATTSSLWRDK
jgi:hypothetical protein